MKFNPNLYGGAQIFKWDRDYLFKVLTSGTNPPIKNPKVAMAFRQIDRADFVSFKHKDSAYYDVEIDIGYGEKFTRPSTLAQMANLMVPRAGGKYLDIGSGSGFFAVMLGYIAGDQGEVFSIERVQGLWEQARNNAAKYENIRNVKFLYRDGMHGLIEQAPFDGIHVAFAMQDVPQQLKMQLSVNGKLVLPTVDNNVSVITRMSMEEFEEEIVPGIVFQEGKEGVA